MLGIVINLVIVGSVFRKNTRGPWWRAARNDRASAAQVSEALQGMEWLGAGPSWG